MNLGSTLNDSNFFAFDLMSVNPELYFSLRILIVFRSEPGPFSIWHQLRQVLERLPIANLAVDKLVLGDKKVPGIPINHAFDHLALND